MHDTIQPNTWQGVIHNHMVIIKIWIDDRISRVTWVSSVRQLQIWLKNSYRWSRKWSRCEENEWGVKNTITRSILNIDQNILDSTFNSSSIRDKMIRWSRRISRKMCEYEKYAFHLSVMKIWASSWKSNQGSNKWWGTEPVIGVQCKKMINEHIPKYRVSDNKVKGCVKPRKKEESPRGKAWQTHRVKRTY